MRGPLIEKMVGEVNKIDWQATDSVLEAIILEANLIKKHQPKYNTKEKSDKSFNYVCITKEKLPKVVVVRGKELENFKEKRVYYGPFTNGSQLKEALKIIRRIFPFLDEKSKSYMEFYRQINLVPDLNDQTLYLQNIKNVKLFFEGKKKRILQNLKKEMKECAKRHEFEKAGEIKRQIFALQHINDVALIKQDFSFPPLLVEEGTGGGDLKNHLALKGTPPQKGGEDSNFRIEAYDIAHLGGKNMVGVMVVVENGEKESNKYRKFKIKTQNNANDTGALKEILERRLAHKEWTYPDLMVVDGGVAQMHTGMLVLKKSGIKIPVVSVVKDKRHKPKEIMGDKNIWIKYKQAILLANSEAHRFAIAYHKNMRNKNFLK
jgi:excinuclease ABC subunit C